MMKMGFWKMSGGWNSAAAIVPFTDLVTRCSMRQQQWRRHMRMPKNGKKKDLAGETEWGEDVR